MVAIGIYVTGDQYDQAATEDREATDDSNGRRWPRILRRTGPSNH